MLFNEPKLLKSEIAARLRDEVAGFSALQRAEIAEIDQPYLRRDRRERFSALQRAEIAEILNEEAVDIERQGFQCSSTSRNC